MTEEQKEEISQQIGEAFAQFESDVDTAFAELTESLVFALKEAGARRPHEELWRIVAGWCADVGGAVERLNLISTDTGAGVADQVVEETEEFAA
jgi:hypothetical protein